MIVQIDDRQTIGGLDLAAVRRGVREALRTFEPAAGEACELSVSLVDDEQIAQLHETYLNDPTPTDVITFPLDLAPVADGPQILGEIVISVETAQREADARGEPINRELVLYAIHGALHLAGYDDTTPKAAAIMEQVQQKILDRVMSDR